MANTVQLEIMTPSKQFYKGDVELVIARTKSGDEGFMAGHAWACKLLDVGELWIREAGAEPNTFKLAAVAEGFIDVKDTIIIYSDDVEWSKDIDVERAEKRKTEAEEWMMSHSEEAYPLEYERAKLTVRKAENRINVAAGGISNKKK